MLGPTYFLSQTIPHFIILNEIVSCFKECLVVDVVETSGGLLEMNGNFLKH